MLLKDTRPNKNSARQTEQRVTNPSFPIGTCDTDVSSTKQWQLLVQKNGGPGCNQFAPSGRSPPGSQ